LTAIDKRFYIFLVNIIFFVSGFYYYTNRKFFTTPTLIYLFILLVIFCFVLVAFFNVESSLESHEYYPDIYYVLAGLASITFFLITKNVLLWCHRLPLVPAIFTFFHKHTFSIFLLHGFGIYFADRLFGYLLPAIYKQHDIKYGLIMLSFTLLVSCPVSIVLTKCTSWCQRFMLKRYA